MSEESFYRNPKFWRWFIPWGFLFVSFVVLFWSDVKAAVRGWASLGSILVGSFLGFKTPSFDSSLSVSMIKVAANILVYIGVYLISIFIVAQFVLPVETWRDRWRAFKRLFWHGVKWLRGPAVFVHNGQLISRVGEEDNINPGVIVVDLRSAVVVEQAYPYLGEADDFPDRPVLEKEPSSERSSGLLRKLRLLQRPKEYPIARVLGPGIHFTDSGEKIRTTVDLRRQVRFARRKTVVTEDGKERQEPGVKAFTRDGIEVGANCYVVFSLSDSPDVIPVGYWGGNEARHLHELEWEKHENTVKIKNIHPLDSSDAEEIHQRVLSAQVTPLSRTPASPESVNLYPLDKTRVFNAAYGQVYGLPSTDKSQWHELPLGIAADIFRNLLERYNFDYLYSVDDPKRLPWMDEFKPEFSRRMRYQGIISFQVVRPAGLPPSQAIHWDTPLDGSPLNIKPGEKFNLDELELSNPYSLQGPKSLRERGIKVLTAGFSELKMPPSIKEKLVERWKARWEKEIQIVLARQEREAMQIISSARNRAQRDNAYFLSNLFKEEKYSTEALALLIFQSLELAATDIENQKELPPREVLGMLQNLHNWLLRERQEMNERRNRHKGKDDSDDNGGSTPVL